MPSRKMEDLKPEMRELAAKFMTDTQKEGLRCTIHQTLRTKDEQVAYFAQHREPLDVVNKLRKSAGLWPITAKENSKFATFTLDSKHLTGSAFDFCLVINGKISWTSPLYKKAGEIGKRIGLVWGGDWPGKKRDPGHFQLP